MSSEISDKTTLAEILVFPPGCRQSAGRSQTVRNPESAKDWTSFALVHEPSLQRLSVAGCGVLVHSTLEHVVARMESKSCVNGACVNGEREINDGY